jgi:hypothetical protein
MAEEQQDKKKGRKLTHIWRVILEAAFIIFLFYSNLLMGEFNHSGLGQRNGLLWALHDIFTKANFIIAIMVAFIGQLIFEFLINRL